MKTYLSIPLLLLLQSSLFAQTDEAPKRSLLANGNIAYNKLPTTASNVGEMLTKGEYYARLRSNSFYWDWKEESSKLKDNKSSGLGASLIYKTAYLDGFGATAGVYTTYTPSFFRAHPDDIGFVKAGKDTFFRHEVQKDGKYSDNTVFAQAYIEYKKEKQNIKLGRQLFHSVFTASNDTKMIPNTFDALLYTNKALPDTKFRIAYIAAQKLRDHATSHDIITVKDKNGDKWNNNDDSGAHKGLTYANFVREGKDPNHDMSIIDFNNKSIKNLNITLSYLSVPGVFMDGVAEAHYKIPLLDTGWSIRPGARYFYQKDMGGGDVAVDDNGKALDHTGKVATGYANSVTKDHSLSSYLVALRTDILVPNKKGFIRFGYSHIANKADIIAPWRGFPTGGYTRAMAQYNWFANTTSYMIQANYKVTKMFLASARYAIQDFDDKKDNTQADSNILHIDTITNISKRLQMKTRMGFVKAKDNIKKSDGSTKSDVSYNEYRLEFNYLF